jgi:Protein of unknown function (DUF3054)
VPWYRRQMLVAPLVDAASILVFVAFGRRSHDESGGLTTTFEIAAPFLIALGIAWLALRAWRQPTDPRSGATIAFITAGLGQLLRRLFFDRGTAFAFVVVSVIATGTLFVGWRLGYRALRPRFARERAD